MRTRIASWLGAAAFCCLGCAQAYPPEEPAFVEVSSTRTRDAGHDAIEDAADDVRGADPPWPCAPCYEVGNAPPHRAR